MTRVLVTVDDGSLEWMVVGITSSPTNHTRVDDLFRFLIFEGFFFLKREAKAK